MKKSLMQFRSGFRTHACAICACAVVMWIAPSPVLADSPTADSNVTTVDTRDGGNISVSGRVLECATRGPMVGVSVTLGGQTVVTLADGSYRFPSVALGAGATMDVAKSGFQTQHPGVAAPAAAAAHVVPDICLAPAAKFGVVSITPKYNGLFLTGASFLNEYNAAINWGGRIPASVEFRVNGTAVGTVPTTGGEAVVELDMARNFFGNLTLKANRIQAVAVDSLGERSAPFEQSVTVLPMPLFLMDQGILLPFTMIPGNQPKLSWEFEFPRSLMSAKAVKTVPFIGQFGPDFAFDVAFDYDLMQGEWGLYMGKTWERRLRHKSGKRPLLYLGNVDVEFGFGGIAEGVASQTRPITVDRVGLELSMALRAEIFTFYVTDYVPGGQLVRLLDSLRHVGVDVNSIQRVRVNGVLDSSVAATLNLSPLGFDALTMNLKPGLEALYEPSLIGAHASISVGGRLDADIQLAPQFGWDKASIVVLLKMHFDSWVFKPYDEQLYILNKVFYQRAAKALSSVGKGGEVVAQIYEEGDWVICRAKGVSGGLMSRDYLGWGGEVFVGGQEKGLTLAGSGGSLLEGFREFGRGPVKGSVAAEGRHLNKFGDPLVGTNQVDLPLVLNAFPYSDPAMAGRSNELMILYVADNGGSNALQFTDIKYTRWDGTNWSTPQAILTNTQAEFSPKVRFDGNGDAVALWERVASPNFTNADLTAMAAQMEVVWSRWGRAERAWTEPVPLTVNSRLDHSPLICGPMAGGDLLAVWTGNELNLIMGTNGAGADDVYWSRWGAATRSWTAPQRLVGGVPHRLSQSLGGAGGHAVYAWTVDGDGVLTNDLDQEVFYCEWTNGEWTGATQLTANSVADKNVRAAVATNGTTYLVWQREGGLVMSRNFSTNVTPVRPDSQTTGFADYEMTVGPMGHLVLLWQDMSEKGSDAHFAVYDPASDSWGKDALLCSDPPLERSFAPVWDNYGNLTVAYNKVDLLHTNKTVTLEGGGEITISNVPLSGRVDLMVTKRALVKDLALLPGDFTIEGNNYLPGDPLLLSALVRNVGNVAVSNAVVGFYDGNPGTSGKLLTNIALPGWLEAAGTNLVTALWVVPEPATNHVIFATVDKANVVTEFNETNNVQQISVGGTDLAVSLVTQQVETNGALRVVAQVRNEGAPRATNSVLSIRRSGSTGVPLATVAVPSLEPGGLAEVVLALPAGTQTEGEGLYTLRADETRVTGDVRTNNNTATFAVNLWVDSDGDGIADSWMLRYFGHTTGTAGDRSRAQDDADGDTVSNLAEFLAGTDPKDAHSYLRITSVSAGGTNGLQIAWGSTTNKMYSVVRSPVLAANGAGFTNLTEHLLATPPQNVFLDTTVTNSSRFFYRIQVEQ